MAVEFVLLPGLEPEPEASTGSGAGVSGVLANARITSGILAARLNPQESFKPYLTTASFTRIHPHACEWITGQTGGIERYATVPSNGMSGTERALFRIAACSQSALDFSDCTWTDISSYTTGEFLYLVCDPRFGTGAAPVPPGGAMAGNVLGDDEAASGSGSTYPFATIGNTHVRLQADKEEADRQSDDIGLSAGLLRVRPSTGGPWYYVCPDEMNAGTAQFVCSSLGFGESALLAQTGGYTSLDETTHESIGLQCEEQASAAS